MLKEENLKEKKKIYHEYLQKDNIRWSTDKIRRGHYKIGAFTEEKMYLDIICVCTCELKKLNYSIAGLETKVKELKDKQLKDRKKSKRN